MKNEDLTLKGLDEVEKSYVSALLPSPSGLRLALLVCFVIVPLAVIYGAASLGLQLYKYKMDPLAVLGSLIAGVLLALIVLAFAMLRKYVVVKVVTSPTGICCHGLLKRVYATWNEIESVKVVPSPIGRNLCEVSTTNGRFYFPPAMKEQGSVYPKVALVGEKWIYANGTDEPISLQNIPLYLEIQRHLTLSNL